MTRLSNGQGTIAGHVWGRYYRFRSRGGRHGYERAAVGRFVGRIVQAVEGRRER